ncbi:MAG: FAD-dependent oxidoreductase [Actinomycetia bacterium]|nr:FAD-dependent oxidoreductase [Actinomycetes bacterium]
MDEDIFDAVVVGGGVAGCVAAYRLASAGHSVVLVERGSEPGAKNLSGGVFYCRVMEEVFPDFARVAPVERRITRNYVQFLNATSSVGIDYWDDRFADPVNAVSVLRGRLDPWLSEQCEQAGAFVMPGVRVDGLIFEGEQVVGVRAGEDELRARVVILADGVNSFIARDAGIRRKPPAGHLAVGVKSVLGLPRQAIEERFHLRGDEGVAYAVVGDATQGLAGGGFLYTNTESISIGVVVRLDDLAASRLSSSQIHDHFLNHPAYAGLLDGAEPIEYGCHLTIENGPALVREELTRPGLMIIGDAAGFTLNTGLTIRGMDLAAGSALAAATAADAALAAGDFSGAAMARYRAELDATFVGRDMRTYERAPKFLENPEMYRQVGELAADVLHRIFDLDTTPRAHLITTARRALKASPLSMRALARLGVGGTRGL